MAFMDATNEHLIRRELWSRQMKELLLDELNAMKFVRILSDFPDGTTFNIPSVGQAETFDYNEGMAVKYNSLDTGNFTFEFTQYKGSANAVTEKFKQDSFYANEVVSQFVPKQHRALMEAIETYILERPYLGQTSGQLNTINTGDHRWIGTGTGNAISLKDFARADYALQVANVPLVNKVAILDPSVAYTLATQANMVNLLSPVKEWTDITNTGGMSGFKFKFNVFGFDVYVSNYLPKGITETIDGTTVTDTGVANYLFSAAPGDTLPWVGAFRQMPTVYSEFNKDLQQDEYLTICRYDFKLYRPENMVTIITDRSVVNQ
jgi:hypothetical protein